MRLREMRISQRERSGNWRAGCLRTSTSGSEEVATRSRLHSCYDSIKRGRNPVFCHWYPTKTCGESNLTVRSSWDNEATSDKMTTKPRGDVVTASIKAVRSQDSGGKVNTCELSLNVVR